MLASSRLGARELAQHEFESETAATDPSELVARIQNGDRAAEELLVVRFGRPVSLLLERHTNGRPEAEDLFQDTFRLTLEKLRRGELREPEKLPGFLAAIARSLAIEHYRKAARRKTEADSDGLAAVAGTTPGPLGAILEGENAGLVRRLLGELANERDRQILFRYYLAEEDKERISADLGLTSIQFNRVLHRARDRYRELLTERLRRTGRSAAAILLTFVTLVLMGRALRPAP